MTSSGTQLALSAGLTAKTNQLCLGLESGVADILELVTFTSAELLMWWLGEDMALARGGNNGGLNGDAPWHYVLLAENVLLEWQAKGARLAELLDYARLRPLAHAALQERLI